VDSGICRRTQRHHPLWALVLSFAVRQSTRPRPLQVAGLFLEFLHLHPVGTGSVDTLGALYCLLAALSYPYMSHHLTPRNLSPTVFFVQIPPGR